MQKQTIVTKVTKKIADDKSEVVGNRLWKVTGGEKPRLVVEREVPSTVEELVNDVGEPNIPEFCATVFRDYALAGILPVKNEFAKLENPSDATVKDFLSRMERGVQDFSFAGYFAAQVTASVKAKRADAATDILSRADISPEEKLRLIQAALQGADV